MKKGGLYEIWISLNLHNKLLRPVATPISQMLLGRLSTLCALSRKAEFQWLLFAEPLCCVRHSALPPTQLSREKNDRTGGGAALSVEVGWSPALGLDFWVRFYRPGPGRTGAPRGGRVTPRVLPAKPWSGGRFALQARERGPGPLGGGHAPVWSVCLRIPAFKCNSI